MKPFLFTWLPLGVFVLAVWWLLMAGGRPSKGTPADRRLRENKATPPKPPLPKQPTLPKQPKMPPTKKG